MHVNAHYKFIQSNACLLNEIDLLININFKLHMELFMETDNESEQDNLVKQICVPLMDEALAACVITRDGKVAFGFGDNCDFSEDASDAAIILEMIGKLNKLKQKKNNGTKK